MKKLKYYLLFSYCSIFLNCSCNHKEDREQYEPGLGEFMMQLEYHHTKLGLALDSSNYKLVGYELDELNENIALIKQYHNNHEKLVQSYTEQSKIFIENSIATMKNNIATKDYNSLQSNYKILTANCNSCHSSNKMEFINIK